MEPAQTDFMLDTICGGPHLAGESNKNREKYARTLHHEVATIGNCMSVEDKFPRHPEETISFTEEDAKHVRYPHTDPLVVTVQIANMKVKRCLVDTGSSVDIIYKSSFEKMKLSVNDLKPYSQVIYGFTGEGLSPTGTMKLVVTTGDMPNHSTVMTEFLIVDCSSAYNVVIGRPLLMALQAAISIWHLTMKFPTSVGIGCTRGDQR